jgi:uncharacterized protein (TIGR03435 family)
MSRPCWIASAVIVSLWAAPQLVAQDTSTDRFEVATVRPTDPNSRNGFGIDIFPGGRILLYRYPLSGLVGTAFRHSRGQIANNGAPWIEEAIYTVEAKAPASAGITNLNHSLFDIDDERLRQMLQALVIERFQLKVHRETRTGDVYQLTRTSKPFGLRPANIPEGKTASSSSTSIGYAGGRWVIRFATMPQLASFASTIVVRAPVVDITNVSGSFDYRQQDPDLDPQYAGEGHAASFVHMLGTVGLELKQTKGPVEWLVIDSAERPRPE